MAIVDVFPLGSRTAGASAGQAGGGGATTARVNRKLWDAGAGAPNYVNHPDGLAQHTAFRNNQISAHVGITPTGASAPTKLGGAFVFRAATTPVTASFQVMSMLTASAIRHHLRWNTTGNLESNMAGGSAVSVLTPTVGVDYWIEWLLDVSGTTHLLDVYVNGVKQTQNTLAGQTATNITTATVGNVNASGTGDMYLSDAIIFDYPASIPSASPFGPRVYVFDQLPISSGPHTQTAGDFKNNAAANVTDGDTSYQLIDEWPPNTTDYVNQAVARTTSFMNFPLQTIPAGFQPIYFKMCGANVPASALALEMGFRLFDGTTASAEAVIDASVAATTLEYHVHAYTAPPTGGSWTVSRANSLAARIGFSNDVSPLFNFTALLGQTVTQIIPARNLLGVGI